VTFGNNQRWHVVNIWFHKAFAAVRDSFPNTEARRALQVPQASTIGGPKST
jgi:hypothetical protein